MQPTVNMAVDAPAGKAAVSDSSANSFSDTLESALGLNEDTEPAATALPGAPQEALLNNGGMPLSPQGQQEAGAERQDMPVENGLFPPAPMMPIVIPPSAAVNSTTLAAASVIESATASLMQKESGTLTSALLLLKARSMDAALNASLSPVLSPSTATALPLPPTSSQSVMGLPMRPEMLVPALALVASPLQNKISADVLADLGKMVNENLFQTPAMVAAPGENSSLPNTAMVNIQSGGISNTLALTSAPAITIPLGSSGWDQELGGRVQWMMTQGLQAAALHINPPHLGPIEVRIVMDQDQASISFNASHMLTRDALEASIPKLRDMLNDNGLNLANVNVASNSFSDQRGQHPGSAAIHPIFSAMDNAIDDVPLQEAQSQTIRNLVDYYA